MASRRKVKRGNPPGDAGSAGPAPRARDALARHALATLPDSLAAREQLLDAIREALPRGSEGRLQAAALGRLLAQHEKLRLEFGIAGGRP